MNADNPRRPGRTDQSTSHAEPGGACFEAVEQLEPRAYADAVPFPAVSPAAAMFAAAGTFSTMDGGGGSGATPLQSANWDNGHTLMGLTQMWADPRFADFRGTGMRTVLLDSGINLSSPFFGPDLDHNGIADRIVYQYDFANNDADATDTMGHGSNVAGAAASSDPVYGGVAPDAGIIALRVFNDQGQGSFGWLERGLRWVVNNAAAYNIASVNLSLGDGGSWTTAVSLYGVGDELAALASMGVIVTAASGNSYYDNGSHAGVAYPAADPNVIAVGAVYGQTGGGFSYSGGATATTSPAGAVTPFTQRGPLMDILAPGAPIVGPSIGSGLTIMHGTSQASPQIAGLAVLAQQMATTLLGRRLSVTEFRSIIVSSATTINDGDDENDNVTNTGADYPLVNALSMAEAIWSMRPVAATPTNHAPTLGTVEPMTGALANRSTVIDFATLARAAHAADTDGDGISFVIEKLYSGTLTLNGRIISNDTSVMRPGDTLVWTPDQDAVGEQTAFRFHAFDGAAASDDAGLLTINVLTRDEPGFARGARLVSDLPGDASSGNGGVQSAQAEQTELPTVVGLNFLEFQTTTRATSSGVLGINQLFSVSSVKLAA